MLDGTNRMAAGNAVKGNAAVAFFRERARLSPWETAFWLCWAAMFVMIGRAHV